jgi:hypothetical protein
VNKITRLYKKLHRWPGLILSFLLLYYGITGILMNHRETFAPIEVNRTNLPANYAYRNWNNAAVKGNLIISNDSILLYGNIGIWVTDSLFTRYRSMNAGFPKGIDTRKIFDVHQAPDGHLYAATLFGFYAFDKEQKQWQKLDLDVSIKRFVGIESVGDTVFALNRSYLFKGISDGANTRFEKIELEAPEGYVNDVGLFETIWQIHSGEVFGLPGKLFVDALGVITIFLSVTGILYFFFPNSIKRRKQRNKKVKNMVSTTRWSLKWHNYVGTWTFAFLIILYFTGMFLRPPLLISIAYARVAPLKFSHLDQPNPWYDKLRDLHYDSKNERLLLSTSDGMFFISEGTYKPKAFRYQPPVSVMGINVWEPFHEGTYLIGSFSGLFVWDPTRPEIMNYPMGSLYQSPAGGRPVGDFKVSGFIQDTYGKQYLVDYDLGVLPLYHRQIFPEMPDNVRAESRMSLWSLSLEIHTGRFFNNLLGIFYILIVPLSGLAGVIVVLSGYLLWRKKYRNKKVNSS